MVLEHCDYEGQILVLSRRGIAGIKAGALDGAPNVKKLRLVHNNFEILPLSAFDGAPRLEFISISRNKIVFLEAGALRNLTQLKELWLNNNLLSSLEDFNGTLNGLPSLELLDVSENDVTCEDLHFGTETWECFD
jgi:Leucine-rich repeat (LRR) protein